MSWKISTRGIPQSITGVAPTLDYRFAIDRNEIDATSLTDKLTYTGGNGTFVGSDGFIQRATTNVPRFDHDPLSRRSLGLLSEVERENLLVRSEEFGTTWTLSGLLAFGSGSALNAAASPDGKLTAALITEDSGTSIHVVTQSGISFVSGTTYRYSCFVKRASGSRNAGLVLRAAAFGVAVRASIDLSSGQVTPAGSPLATESRQYPNGWWRVELVATATATTTSFVDIGILSGTGLSYTGDETSGIYIWGAQLEAASTPSSYIPTTSAAVTRTADSAVIDGTGVITGTYTMVEKPAGCAVVSGTNIELQPGFRAERIAVFPAALTNDQITAVRAAM